MGAAALTPDTPAPTSEASAPVVGDGHIDFFVHDPDHDLNGVKLAQELARPRLGPDFVRFANSDRWRLSFPRPDSDRMEYQLQLTFEEGRSELVCDPTNPLRAPGAFGEKSVLEFPGYEAPAWVRRDPAPDAPREQIEIKSRGLRRRLVVTVWSSPGTTSESELPLLVAHDGPDYAIYSGLLMMLDRLNEEGRLPPMRAALLPAVDRDQTYSASAAYGRALAHEILPALSDSLATPHGRRMRIGMGASLGALAMLHVHRNNPATFGALFLQSGSYFRQRFDKQESHFVRFRRINRFVGSVLSAEQWMHPIPVVMTCGTVEENLANNRAIAAALERQDYPLIFHANRDAHNWVGWRDTFDPLLVDLLSEMWG